MSHCFWNRRARRAASTVWVAAAFLCGTAQAQFTPLDRDELAYAGRGRAGSPYVPVDHWMYPAVLRLYALGYLPSAFLGMRPYTRASLAHMLLLQEDVLRRPDTNDEAMEIYARLRRELAPEFALEGDNLPAPEAALESGYSRVRAIHGPVLNDSFHLGQTFTNDYGRPFQSGFNNVTGYSGYATEGRWNLYVRGEYQHAPAADGYTAGVAQTLSTLDALPPGPHLDIPQGPLPATNQARLLEANLSVHALGHQVSFGRSDSWLGPAEGASMAYSNNSEPTYAFRINRIEPLWIKGLSRYTGPFRYEFFVGSLKGHDVPNDPWLHTEKISFKPLTDLEFGFARTVIWGGEGHVPITFHTFLRSFFSPAGVAPTVKFSRDDPGARFSTFDSAIACHGSGT